jgi:hypothetical protein
LGSSSPPPASAMASSTQPHDRRRCYTGNREGRLALPRQPAVRAAPVEALEISSGSSRARADQARHGAAGVEQRGSFWLARSPGRPTPAPTACAEAGGRHRLLPFFSGGAAMAMAMPAVQPELVKASAQRRRGEIGVGWGGAVGYG